LRAFGVCGGTASIAHVVHAHLTAAPSEFDRRLGRSAANRMTRAASVKKHTINWRRGGLARTARAYAASARRRRFTSDIHCARLSDIMRRKQQWECLKGRQMIRNQLIRSPSILFACGEGETRRHLRSACLRPSRLPPPPD
jgi:hypothetical protein